MLKNTIFSYFNSYTPEQVVSAINSLPVNEQNFLFYIFGSDLTNPVVKELDIAEQQRFNLVLLPKLAKNLQADLSRTLDTFQIDIKLDSDQELALLLKKRHTCDELCNILNIDYPTLYQKLLSLKNKGMILQSFYDALGNLSFVRTNTMHDYREIHKLNQMRSIKMNPEETTMKFLLLADLHICNDLERLDLIDKAFNYCVKKGIHIILNGGDFIDGTYTQGVQKISELDKQVEYFLNNYPFDKHILTFGVGGDHDISLYNQAGIDFIKLCENYRPDIIIPGYNNAFINLQKDLIHLFHRIDKGYLCQSKAKIVLHGHFHKYAIEQSNGKLHIMVPALSNINQKTPSGLELECHFNNGQITDINLKQIYFGNKDLVISEKEYDLTKLASSEELLTRKRQ